MDVRERAGMDQPERLVVTKNAEGWELRETRGQTVVRTQQYRDWHRVERALQAFDLHDLSGASSYSTKR